ncbi:MAG TPA: TlpA disulfide reductase family protein [Acidobacteriaceae bacterium]|jgi:thiol-disulfide isomerase/thioredoxin|nr:TlpA disulfide reductase family protein [Acidobacteriaceae bacterium]
MRSALLAPSLSLLLIAASSGLRAQTPALPADLPAAAQSAYKQGLDFETRQQFDSALDSYKSAAKQCSPSLACMEAIVRVQMMMEHYKDAAATAAKLASSTSDPHAKAAAELLATQALFRQSFAYTEGEGAFDKNPKRALDSLRQAESVAAQGTADDPGNEPLRMLHARILAALHRDEDASREFKACAALPGTPPAECDRALRLASDVESGRSEPVPAFTLKTLDGQTVTRDSLAGKVVLIDFWATWCPACRRDSGYVQSLLDSFPDGRFVLLEVDIDESRDKWSTYVADHRLKGTQTRDDDRSVQGVFHVGAYPTYIIFDGNGTVRLRAKGIEGDLRGTVRKLLAEQSANLRPPASQPLTKPGE